MGELQIGGARIHVEDRGSGPPVLFCHGLFWDGRMYDAQVAALADRYRAVTMDFRGQGRSEVTRGGYDMDTLTNDAIGVIDALGLAPCHFVGLSMGGFVGIRLAARRPELVRSLVLIDTAADGEPARNRLRYGALRPIGRVLGIGPFVGEVMRAMFGPAFLEDPSRTTEREEMRRRIRANDSAGATRSLAGVTSRVPVEDLLPTIRTPTLVLSGEHDASIVPARSRRTAELIPGATFTIVPRAGHSSTIEEPAFVTAALEAFLAGK